jgi:8-oxo-dGTP diphosphatase
MPPDDSAARVPLGPVGGYVMKNLKELRQARGLTYKELSDRLREIGRDIPTLGLSRIEKGARRVDADDLVAIAIVLSVNPSALLLPRDTRSDAEIRLADRMPVRARDAWDWADARLPVLDGEVTWEARADFARYGRPSWDAVVADEEAERNPAAIERALSSTKSDYRQRAAAFPVEPDVDGQRPIAVAIVASAGRVLVAERVDATPPWTFPGGEVEPGDPASETAVREIKEETGLDIRAVRIIGRRDHPRTGRHMIYVEAKPVRGTEVHVGDRAELATVDWVDLTAVLDLMPDMFGPVREYLAAELGNEQ